MNKTEVRLKALVRLAQSTTEAAEAALLTELNEVAETLKTQSDYETLLQGLEVLNAIGYRLSARTVDIIESFIRTIEGRKLTYSQAYEGFTDYITKYCDTQSLIVKAVEVVIRLRYYETRAVLRILLALHDHSSKNVRKKVRSGLDSLGKYDLDVFYGVDRKGGLGTAPQDEVLKALESMGESGLKANHEALLLLLTCMLSPIMEGVSWTYNAATISHNTIPAHPSMSDVRARSIQLLCRLYLLSETKSQKLAVITALSEGARTDYRVAANEAMQAMIGKDSVEILAFFTRLVPSEDFQIVQKVEEISYRIFVRALSEEVTSAALTVEKAIADNKEYAIYRTLIGFEGIFGDWSANERSSGKFETIEKERRRKASEFAYSINADNYAEWRARILEYAKTESDDLATFPVFYHFLSEFADARPELAVRLVTVDTAGIARFLIPILSSLWNGNHKEHARTLIERWIGEAQASQDHHLFAATKMFLLTNELDVELLKRLLEKAAEIKDISSVRQVVTVAIARWKGARGEVLTELLYPAMDVLTEMKDASWIFEAWFRNEARELFEKMDADGIDRTLKNLLVLDKIDYHAEEVLYALGKRNPERVMRFLISRLAIEAESRNNNTRDFDAIPFEFYKLQELLSKIPRIAVRSVLEQYRADATLFVYRGAALLKNIFPEFPEEFEGEMLQLVREGGENNLEFVVGVLRNYHGEPFLHRLCKEVVKAVDSDSSLLNEVAIALETTGVVSGEFGMAEAYARKRQEVLDWLSDPNEKVKAFAKRYIADIEKMHDAETIRAKEEIALRKHRFGEQ